MARNNSGFAFRNAALVLGTIGGGAALGYYVLGGVHPGQASDVAGIQEAPMPPAPPTAPAHAAPKPKPTQVSSDYTAPNAPRIHIVEDKTPTLNDSSGRPADARAGTDATDIPTPDVEASQQGGDTASAAPSPNGSSLVSPGPDTPPTPDASSDTEAGQTGASGNQGTTGKDTEANQTGDSPPTGARASYRIQAGTFADAGNARDLVNSLHDKGVDANMRTEHQGEKTVYKVQVGAYRSRAAADDAAAGFRSEGVPVTVSPVSP